MKFFTLRRGKPDGPFLCTLLEYFSHLPYENISKIIKWNRCFTRREHLRLPEEVISEHIDRNLGGTCFSLTFFLQTILYHNGFRCYPVTADMRAGKNIHCALIVWIDGQRYLVDPGYLLNQPMLLNSDRPRLFRSAHAGVELQFERGRNRYHLFTFNRQGKKWRYSFVDQPATPDKFLRHWEESFYRNSMHGLCLTKVQKDGLIYIHNTFMRETNLDGKKNYNLRNRLHHTIQNIFGIQQDLVEQALAALKENLQREKVDGSLRRESDSDAS